MSEMLVTHTDSSVLSQEIGWEEMTYFVLDGT